MANAARITRCRAGPFGSASPFWFTAEPRSSAKIGCPLRTASDRRSTSTIPAPSAQPAPPASARSHSPARSDCPAQCSATSDDEHAVSTVTAGPSRPKMPDTRPDSPLPVALTKCPESRSWPLVPTNTPVELPRSVAGSMPARSNASQEVSSTSRCGGSMASASPGEIPKKSASKSAAPHRNPAASGEPDRSRPRASARTSSHSCPGVLTPPGNRQAIATIAIGSRPAVSSSRTRSRACRSSAVTALRQSRSFSSSATGTPLPCSRGGRRHPPPRPTPTTVHNGLPRTCRARRDDLPRAWPTGDAAATLGRTPFTGGDGETGFPRGRAPHAATAARCPGTAFPAPVFRRSTRESSPATRWRERVSPVRPRSPARCPRSAARACAPLPCRGREPRPSAG